MMISIIIPLYNKEAIVERSLVSVLSQNYDDYEIVVVDDGSTDNSLGIVKKIKDSNEDKGNKINIVIQENGGPSKARNTGVKHAKGDWIVFLDADDELLPGALKHFMNLSIVHNEVCFYSCMFCNSYKGKVENGFRAKDGYIQNPFKAYVQNKLLTRTGAGMYSRELVLSCPFNEQLRRYEDFDVWFRMYEKSPVYLSSIPVLKTNVDYTEASKVRKEITEDFIGHLYLTGKGFWHRLSLYRLFLEERQRYPLETRELYPSLFYRIDLLLIYKIIRFFS